MNSEYDRLVKKISANAVISWSFPFTNNETFLGPRDMIIEQDGIVCSSIGSPPDTLYSSPVLFKLDKFGNILWFMHTPNSYIYHFQYMENLTRTCDGGYVGAAKKHISQIEGDTLNAESNYAAWLIRYDHEGNILWDQKYAIVNSAIYHHEIYDLISTSDGGILFCGEAADYWLQNTKLDSPPQQAWVVKLDACGCLVPGYNPNCTPPDCDTTSTVIVPEDDYFLYGPNPVSQMLNIFAGADFPVGSEFKLFDSIGRVAKSFTATECNITFMWDLESLTSGEYVLSLERGKERLQSEKILKL